MRLALLSAMIVAPAISIAAEPSIVLSGNRSAALASATDLGSVDDATEITSPRLLLRRSAAQQQAFDEFTAAQQDRNSPFYHEWATPAEIGADFGPSEAAVAKAVAWLGKQGFTVGAVSPTRMSIAFSGTAATFRSAMHAAVHEYRLRGRRVAALAADPAIPASLSEVVSGVLGVVGSMPEPQVRPVGPVVRSSLGTWRRVAPSLTTTAGGMEQEDVTPADFATIYDIQPLRTAAAPLLGTGQTIAVVEDSDILPSDWNTFRSAFGLSGYGASLTTIHPGCSDPGRNADEVEAALDAEWATAVAPAVSVTLASCSDDTGGIQSALEGVVDAATRPSVISVSYGECEAQLGAAGARSWAALVQQGAAEGISIFVSSGDSGSAGCDNNTAIASNGLSVNGLASSPDDVAVGGTDFSDVASNVVPVYWNKTNTSSFGSARFYVPEIPWNDTCANPALASYEGSSNTLAFCNGATGQSFLAPGGSGGGASTLFAKPAFQSTSIAGMPNDGARDLPDVSLFASNGLFGHALLYCMSDRAEGGSPCTYTNGNAIEASSAGGTSFAAPAFAGIQALINQKKAAPQGNPDARLYALAASQYQTALHCRASYGALTTQTCTFHDVSSGNNDQACSAGSLGCYSAGNSYGVLSTSNSSEVSAYSANVGYDLATGLGSVNVRNLVSNY